MRVISGTHRRRTLLGPQGDRVTRPIPDRVKQSLFDRLWSMGCLECAGAVDLFAGTGSLGIEALSRGVDHCVFVERDRSARSLLEQNLANLGLTPRSTVLGIDALMTGATNLFVGRAVGLVFADPPYQLTDQDAPRSQVLAMIQRMATVTEPGGVLVLRTDRQCQPDPVAAWLGPESYTYGSTTVHVYQRPWPDEPLQSP